jgi:hypothetical protein
VPADHRPSYEELAAENAQLRVMVEELRTENAELRRRVGQNSRGTRRSRRRRTRRFPSLFRSRCGAREWPQSRRAAGDIRDQRWRWPTSRMSGCGMSLVRAPAAVRTWRRPRKSGSSGGEVFDLPPMTVRVREHQLLARRCAWGTTTCATAPEGGRRGAGGGEGTGGSTGRGSPHRRIRGGRIRRDRPVGSEQAGLGVLPPAPARAP